VIIPVSLRESCSGDQQRRAWLRALPDVVDQLRQRWAVTLGPPFDGDDVSCSWVAPAVRSDGTRVVFKIGMPHMEGRDEVAGLRFWNGDPTVRLFDADDSLNAMLLEACEPGTSLRALAEPDQDLVIAALLRRVWRTPPDVPPFRPLATMIAHWMDETAAASDRWLDEGLVRDGLRAFDALIREPVDAVVLATDLHAANVLAAKREPWLVIDPKPFVGDPAYDATQHLLNCPARLRRDPLGTIRRFTDRLGLDAERVRLWLFARSAAGPGCWSEESNDLARTLA
jgi:streptomycin 6-kinase